MSQLSEHKLELLRAITERITGRRYAWLGLLDEYGVELTAPKYARKPLGANWLERTADNISFVNLGPVYVSMTALYHTPTGGKPSARCRLSAGAVWVPDDAILHVTASFPKTHT